MIVLKWSLYKCLVDTLYTLGPQKIFVDPTWGPDPNFGNPCFNSCAQSNRDNRQTGVDKVINPSVLASKYRYSYSLVKYSDGIVSTYAYLMYCGEVHFEVQACVLSTTYWSISYTFTSTLNILLCQQSTISQCTVSLFQEIVFM